MLSLCYIDAKKANILHLKFTFLLLFFQNIIVDEIINIYISNYLTLTISRFHVKKFALSVKIVIGYIIGICFALKNNSVLDFNKSFY